MEHGYKGRERKGEHKTHARTHTHTHTTVTYADNAENYRLVHTYTKCSELACTDREHTHMHSGTQTQTGFSES